MAQKLRTLPAIDAAYIAGVVDGEGTITLARMHRGENRRPVVSISNTEIELLQHVRAVIGAGRITSKRITAAHHSPSFTYVLSSRGAIALLIQIAPYLRTYKAKRAHLLIGRYIEVTPRNGRYSSEQKAARDAFEREFFTIRVRREIRLGG